MFSTPPKITAALVGPAGLALAAGLAATPAAALTIENVHAPAPPDRLAPGAVESAEPLPLPEVTAEELARMRSAYREVRPAPEGSAPLTVPSGGGGAAPGQPERVDDPAGTHPYSAVGRLVFIDAGEKKGSCTAQFVGSPRVLMTAAHCVYDQATATFNREFVFYRAYDEGTTAQIVDWRCAAIYREFHAPMESDAFDYAFLYMDEASDGGWLGLATQPPASEVVSVGYPDNYGGGEAMYRVTGAVGQAVRGLVTMRDNPMSDGSSGGAWIADPGSEADSGANLVTGLNSHEYVGAESLEIGPAFDAATYKLFRHVEGGGCTG